MRNYQHKPIDSFSDVLLEHFLDLLPVTALIYTELTEVSFIDYK